jgi:hypothetical protein
MVMAGQRRTGRGWVPAQVQEILGEAVESVGDAEASRRIAGGVLAAVAIGAGVGIATLRVPLHASAGTGIYLSLLALVIMSLLGSAATLALSRRPVDDALEELRRLAGAPVDLSVPWTPIQAPRFVSEDQARDLLFPAVSLRNMRVRRALIWAGVTFAGFFVWAAAAVVVAGRI